MLFSSKSQAPGILHLQQSSNPVHGIAKPRRSFALDVVTGQFTRSRYKEKDVVLRNSTRLRGIRSTNY